MRDNLNISQPYMQFVTDQSTAPRHGSIMNVSAEKLRASLERTWIIANQFLEFLKRGKKPLPLSEFPLL